MTKLVWAGEAPPVPGDPPVPGVPPVPGDPPVPGVPPVPGAPAVPCEPPRPPLPGAPPVAGAPPVPVVALATQALFAQCSVAVQAAPQLPQFRLLVVVSTQLVPHSVCPLAQAVMQLSLLQTRPA